MHLGHLLRIPFQALIGTILERLAEEGFDDVRAAHLPVFQHIRRGGSRLSELARLAQMTPQSMGYLVDSLSRLGYVERRPDPDDARAVRVCLTERGWAEVAAARAAIDALEAEWTALLGEGRYGALLETLTELTEALGRKGYV